MNAHLTETQLFALLDSKTQPGSNLKSIDAAHLAGCATCRAEFDVLRDSIANFRIAATNLSALYTPTRLLEPPVTARPRFFTVPRAAWAGGLVAAMALCTASIGVLYHPAPHTTPTTQAPPGTDSDDALLDSVETDLSTSVAPSLQPLDVTAASEKTTFSSK